MASLKFTLPILAGSALGTAQTFILREFVDTPMATSYNSGTTTSPPFLKTQLKGYGSPSSFIGIVDGIATLGLGMYGASTGKIIKNDAINFGLIGFGASALTGGILSGMYPTNAWTAAIAKDPSNPAFSISTSQRKPTIVPVNGSAAPNRMVVGSFGTNPSTIVPSAPVKSVGSF